MDVRPLTDKIEENARQNAEGILGEARARITAMQAATDDQLQGMQEDTLKQARLEGDRLEQNLKRLHALEQRKDLLARKRGLLDEAFDAAKQAMRGMPKERLKALFMNQLLANAQGTEEVTPGDISGDFYDAAFLEEANQALKKAGKPGALKHSGRRREGVTGLILSLPGSESQLTLETLLLQGRDALEGDVANLLCGGLS